MVFRLNAANPTNPIVFLDFQIGQEKVGRMIIELRQDVVPKTAENFRALCTGECGLSGEKTLLHYKNIKMHKVQRMFMAQGGDIVNNNGTCGESIYGRTFADENFTLLHEAGVLSMANYGRPNTNNSQFFITAVDCPHLDGTNVVFGQILRGFGIVNEMEKFASDDAVPLRDMIIADCGEIKSPELWNYYDNDTSDDKLPPFPIDWLEMPIELDIENILIILNNIKNAGNFYFKLKEYALANRKYRKAERYYKYFLTKLNYSKTEIDKLKPFHLANCLNYAASELELKNFVDAKNACNEVLEINKTNPKALFRRGQAEIALKNYDEALRDLADAHKLSPKSGIILNEFNRVKNYWKTYNAHQKKAYRNIFKHSNTSKKI